MGFSGLVYEEEIPHHYICMKDVSFNRYVPSSGNELMRDIFDDILCVITVFVVRRRPRLVKTKNMTLYVIISKYQILLQGESAETTAAKH